MKTDTDADNDKDTANATEERVLQGLGVSAGVAIGHIFFREPGDVPVSEKKLAPEEVSGELARFEKAVEKARRQLRKLRQRATSFHGSSAEELGYLLEAHDQMLQSGHLHSGVARRIEQEQVNAEAAVATEIEEIAGTFNAMEDPYLRSRGSEVQHVGQRILRNLTDRYFQSYDSLPRNSIIVAEEITPADTALMNPARIGGFAAVLGGAEGHTAIMARALGLPAVLGVSDLLTGIAPGTPAILDGEEGRIFLNPSPERLAFYQERRKEQAAAVRALSGIRNLPAETLDGTQLTLQANLELPSEIPQARDVGAEGIGLLRTEFLFMNREDLPGEAEQTRLLQQIVSDMTPLPVTIRTLDVGGEKLAPSLGQHIGTSPNPAMGLRAIRLSLKMPELLRTQFSAILRASVSGPVRILLPMISSTDQVVEARGILQEVAADLRAEGVNLPDPLPPLGVMIEVPGAALAADALAEVSDFFAIGTNDLISYTLAIDRGEERVANLYDPLHAGVLRLIHQAITAAGKWGRPVSVCGEMAADPRYTGLFLGLGVRELSMGPKALPRVKARTRSLHLSATEKLAEDILAERDRAEVSRRLDRFLEELQAD
ncbi:phosphoenolpyruvate--protein phosphotransferase [Fodinicurvata fenggangensis]|uniref:phosphoenolpyruvate--protein phosphotransferase n=1 Tax=Fodinicurvata fenggangensis TaxID=1121830 RepID=UPI000552A815|nr:phosphoenolpyruvate--protein phosphotransferase [Fodinicurvata fenggangensis]